MSALVDPTSMAILETLALDGLERPGRSVTFGTTPFLRGDTLFFAAAYYSNDEQIYERESRLVVVDTRTLGLKSVVADERCAFLAHAVRLSNGDAYFGSDALAATAALAAGSPALVDRLAAPAPTPPALCRAPAPRVGLSLPHFRGHPNWRENAPGVFNGQAKEAA